MSSWLLRYKRPVRKKAATKMRRSMRRKAEDKPAAAAEAYFVCLNCGNNEPIKPKTLIYSQALDIQEQDIDLKELSDMCRDKTLPRTKSYICPNKKCPTQNDPTKKE